MEYMENTYTWWPDAGVQLSSINEPLSLAIYILCHAYSDEQNYDNDNPMQYMRIVFKTIIFSSQHY